MTSPHAAARGCLVIFVACALLAAGCDKLTPARSPFKTIDVTGSDMGQRLHLTDFDGKARSLADFRGKVVVVTFGFTNCPDVCPTTLANFATALRKLGPDGSQVQVLFITLDPERDTPELLRQYVPAFHPSFIGLWGDAAAIAQVTGDFKIHAQKRPSATDGHYTVDHSAQAFVFDRQGRIRLMMPFDAPVDAIAADIRILLNS